MLLKSTNWKHTLHFLVKINHEILWPTKNYDFTINTHVVDGDCGLENLYASCIGTVQIDNVVTFVVNPRKVRKVNGKRTL